MTDRCLGLAATLLDNPAFRWEKWIRKRMQETCVCVFVSWRDIDE